MENDNEVKGTGNSLDFGARMYDARLGRWWSVDPEGQFIGSQYHAFANNPILLTDPDGGWVPGVDGNGKIILTAEEGDNMKSLYDFFGGKTNAAKYLPPVMVGKNAETLFMIITGKKVVLNSENIFSKTMKYYTENKEKKFDGKATYDCKDLALTTVLEDEAKEDTYGINTPEDLYYFGESWSKKEEVSEDKQQFGETFSFWSWTPPIGEHAAVFFGKDRNDNEYFFSKNGTNGELTIMSKEKLGEKYNLFNMFRTNYKSSKKEQPATEETIK